MAQLTISPMDKVKVNPSNGAELNNRFNDLIFLLERCKHYVLEACFDNDNVYIIFNTDYNFLDTPKGLDVTDIRLWTCDECRGICPPNTACSNISDWKTAIVYPDTNPNLSIIQLKEVLEDLTAWVDELQKQTHCSISGRIMQNISR